MNDPANTLLQAVLRTSLLLQLMFYRGLLIGIRFIRAHKSVLYVVTWMTVVGPYVLLATLLIVIAVILMKWVTGS